MSKEEKIIVSIHQTISEYKQQSYGVRVSVFTPASGQTAIMISQFVDNHTQSDEVCCSKRRGCNDCGRDSEGYVLTAPLQKKLVDLPTGSKRELIVGGFEMTIASRSTLKLHPARQERQLEAATTFGNELIGRDESLGFQSN
jgi:hypothetical protein